MNFLSPLSLLWFIPLAAVVILLYLLKLKRKEQIVSSVMLWRDAVADIQANAPFQKLKKSLLLLLQLAALLVLVLALARPFAKVPGVSENKIVAIIDCSASMQATDVSPSRFDDAKSKSLDIVNRMGPGDTMLVMAVGSKSRVVIPFTSDKESLTSAISGLKPVDTPCNMRQAMVLALSLVAQTSTSPARIIVLSDGIFDPLTDLSPKNAKLDFIRIGKECDNVGITSLSSRKSLSGDQEVFIGLQNFSKRERKFNLELYLNDQLLDIREETMAAGTARQELLKDISKLSGRVTAKLDIKDDLASDNTAYVYLTDPRKISVLLVSKGNIFLQNALNLDPNTQLTKTESLPADLQAAKYDLVVFDGIAPPDSLPQGGYLLVNTFASQGPADEGEPVNLPTIIDSAKDHPASAYVDFSNVRIKQAHYLKLRPGSAMLVEGSGGPLAAAGSRDGRMFVQLGWNIMDSDFPLRVGFPIFIADCLDWLVPPEMAGGGQSVRTGQTVYLDVPPSAKELTVTNPDGSKHTVPITQTPVPYDNDELVGIYKVSGKGIDKEFACNLASSQTSNTAPVATLAIGGQTFVSSGQEVRTNREYYWPLILVVLAVLVFEWYAYHRRI